LVNGSLGVFFWVGEVEVTANQAFSTLLLSLSWQLLWFCWLATQAAKGKSDFFPSYIVH